MNMKTRPREKAENLRVPGSFMHRLKIVAAIKNRSMGEIVTTVLQPTLEKIETEFAASKFRADGKTARTGK
jgi:hypothetical protein